MRIATAFSKPRNDVLCHSEEDFSPTWESFSRRRHINERCANAIVGKIYVKMSVFV